MAKVYRALSNIRHGVAGEDGAQTELREFPYGAVVQGLDTDTMKRLWDAGVLEEVDIPEAVVTPTEPASTAAGSSGGTAAPQGE